MKIESKSDPLAPIAGAVTALAALVGAALLLSLCATIWGSGSLLGFGSQASICAPADTPVESVIGTRTSPARLGSSLRDAAQAIERAVDICLHDPGPAARWEYSIAGGASLLFLVGVFLLTGGVIRAARAQGLFARAVASRTRVLGWFLLTGSLASAFLGSVSAGLVVARGVEDQSWTVGLRTFDTPWTLVVVGLGVISVARILSRAVSMQDDLDTVI
jgi:hypothetical protein